MTLASTVSPSFPTDASSPSRAGGAPSRLAAVLDVALVLLVFALYAAQPTPAENEAHYLAKARHYWNPAWCPHDFFLNSADAHAAFYWSFGWVTSLCSLPAAAWIGRFATWTLLAWSWRRLSWAICPKLGYAALAAGLFVAANCWGAMAGEWVVGGVEAKGFAYALVFLAIEALLRNRWNRGLLLLGAATTFHVLVGGWSLVSVGAAWIGCERHRPAWRSLAPAAIGAVLLALPGLVPALAMTARASVETVREANEIYVYGRLGHHLLFHRLLFDPTQPYVLVVRHLALLVAWVALGRLTPCELAAGRMGQRPLRGFVGGAVMLACIGAALDQLLLDRPAATAAVMKYYWFRLSDAMLPVGVAFAWTSAIVRWRELRPTFSRVLWIAAIVVTIGQSAWSVRTNARRTADGVERFPLVAATFADQPAGRVGDDWLAVCRWIADHSPPDAVFLTPRWQQTFKWFAQRAEVATWKDVPQDSQSVVAWWERLGEIYTPEVSVAGLSAHSDERLVELGARYGAKYLLLDRMLSQREPRLPRLYPLHDADLPGAAFAVYRLEKTPDDR